MGRSEGSAFSLLRSKKFGGIHIPHNKGTAESETVVMPLPSQIVLPMKQHAGAPCEPLVKKKDHVDVGQMVGHVDARTTCDIFSPVSGTVKEVKNVFYANGASDKAIVIEPDGEQTVAETVAVPEVTDYASLVAAVKASGIVGLGGAGFPTGIKMDTDLSNIDSWLVNAAECEPYLTGDYREMIEHPDMILYSLKTCLDLSGVPRGVICIEDNKPRAIEILREMSADDPRIEIFVLPARYPQGASRVILHNVTGRSVPRGGHLTDVGALLFNVTTMSEIGKYLKTGMPLIKRRITVAGDAIENPQNVEVFIGTPIEEVIDFCGRAKEPAKVIAGGPMMGPAQVNLDYPVIRQNSGLLVFSEEAAKAQQVQTTACIRCGKCTNNCPMKLSPINIQRAFERRDAAALDELMADLCVECGSCSYVCPAKQPLAQSTRLARAFLRAEQRKARKGH